MEKIFVDIFTFKHSFCSPEVNMNYNHVYNILRFFDVWADLQKWNEAWLLISKKLVYTICLMSCQTT